MTPESKLIVELALEDAYSKAMKDPRGREYNDPQLANKISAARADFIELAIDVKDDDRDVSHRHSGDSLDWTFGEER